MAAVKDKQKSKSGFMVPTYDMLAALFLSLGFVFYSEDYRLNIIGIRAASDEPNAFNDYLLLAFKVFGAPIVLCFRCTTDPGLYYRQNPVNVLGTGFLKRGQYVDCYKIGLHQGKYPALVQCKPMTVYRDNDKDAEFDKGTEETVVGGFNIHRASETGISTIVDKWSAACQVVADFMEFKMLMVLAEKCAALYGKYFTYTLLDEADVTSK